ncbi:hypothetical protein ABW636_08235 [Aquimarina sp. 2201CG1-2-11]
MRTLEVKEIKEVQGGGIPSLPSPIIENPLKDAIPEWGSLLIP